MPGYGRIVFLKRSRLFKSLLAVVSMHLWSFATNAAELSYSGRLTEASGKPLEGPVALKIRFYREETAGIPVGPLIDFPETPLRDGVYQVILSLTPQEVSEVFGSGDTGHIFIEVDANGTVHTRQRYLPNPFALRVPIDNNSLTFNATGKLQVETISETQVSGLSAKLDSLSNPEVARNNLGLGSLATSSTVSSAQIANGAVSNIHIDEAAGIQDSKLATIASPGKVSGDAITSGMISGTTGLNISGPVSLANILKLKAGGSSASEIRFEGTEPTSYLALRAPSSLGTALTWTLPNSNGNPNQVLSTNGFGVLSWSNPGSGGTVTSVGFNTGDGLSVIGSPVTGSGSISLSLSGDVAALESLSTTGVVERTGESSWSTFSVTGPGKELLDDPSTAAQRTTLGLGNLSTLDTVSGGSGGTLVDGTITNDDISPGAGIAQDKISGLSSVLSGKEGTIAAGTLQQYYRGDKTWQALNTTVVSEGTNQYFTPIRAREAVNVSGAPLTYDSTSGILGINQATGSVSGYLSSSDFNVFNNKQPPISSGVTVNAGTLTTAQQNGIEIRPYSTATGNTGELRFAELAANGSQYVGFKAPDILTSSGIWTLPSSDGTNGQFLSTNGSKVLSWTTPSIAAGAIVDANISDSAAIKSTKISISNDAISGDKIDGGTISNFSSTGIDDNASATAMTITSASNVGIGTLNPTTTLQVNGQVASTLVYDSTLSMDMNLGTFRTNSVDAGTLVLNNMVDATTYTLILTNASGGNFTLSSPQVSTWRCQPTCTSNVVSLTAGQNAVLSITKVGSKAYVFWTGSI